MRFRIPRRAGVVAVAAIGALLAGMAPASAAPGDGSAYGASVDVTLLGAPAVTVGPLVVSSTAGPTSNTLANIAVPGILTTGTVTTSANLDQATGTVTSDATTAGVALPLLAALGGPTIGTLEATCTATQSGITGTTTVADANLGTIGTVNSSPAPNTTLTASLPVIGDVAQLIFNEQITNPDGSLTVNALRVHLLGGVAGIGTGDLIISSATCGPAAPPIPMASGAGLWIGLGLLVAAGLPAGVVFVRRNRAASAV